MIVELLGAPGVGKSTLIPRVIDQLAAAGLPVAPRPRTENKAVAFARFAARHPKLVARSIAAIIATGQRTPRDLTWVIKTWLKRCWRTDQLRTQPGLHLVDAGLAQALWSLEFRARGHLELERLGPFALPDLVLVIEASPATMARRLASRPGSQSRLERDPDADHRRAIELVTKVRESLETRGVTTIATSNDDDAALDAIAATLADSIRARWSA